MEPGKKNTQATAAAHLNHITATALHIANMRDVATSRECLHTMFLNYTTHIFDDGIQSDEHDDICCLYIEFTALLDALEAYNQQQTRHPGENQ